MENKESGKYGVWKMRSLEIMSVENVECGKYGVWKMRTLEKVECGK